MNIVKHATKLLSFKWLFSFSRLFSPTASGGPVCLASWWLLSDTTVPFLLWCKAKSVLSNSYVPSPSFIPSFHSLLQYYFGNCFIFLLQILSCIVLIIIVNEAKVDGWGWAEMILGSICFFGQIYLTVSSFACFS